MKSVSRRKGSFVWATFAAVLIAGSLAAVTPVLAPPAHSAVGGSLPQSGGGGIYPGDTVTPTPGAPAEPLPDRVTVAVFKELLRFLGPTVYLWTERMLEEEARRLGLIN